MLIEEKIEKYNTQSKGMIWNKNENYFGKATYRNKSCSGWEGAYERINFNAAKEILILYANG